MKKIAILFFLPLILIGTEAYAQKKPQPLPGPTVTDPPDDWFLKILFNNKFRIGGLEAGASTYGLNVGLPVFWTADQLKLVPMLGWYWETPAGWTSQGVLGGKILYFINKQQDLLKGDMNPYIGGFSMMEGKDFHNSGIAIGIQPHFSRYLKLGFELQAGLRSEIDEDRAFGGAAITIGVGW